VAAVIDEVIADDVTVDPGFRDRGDNMLVPGGRCNADAVTVELDVEVPPMSGGFVDVVLISVESRSDGREAPLIVDVRAAADPDPVLTLVLPVI